MSLKNFIEPSRPLLFALAFVGAFGLCIIGLIFRDLIAPLDIGRYARSMSIPF